MSLQLLFCACLKSSPIACPSSCVLHCLCYACIIKTIVFIYLFYVCGSLHFVCCFCECFCHHVSLSLTYIHASPAHLYILPLFTHCLPTYCVMFSCVEHGTQVEKPCHLVYNHSDSPVHCKLVIRMTYVLLALSNICQHETYIRMTQATNQGKRNPRQKQSNRKKGSTNIKSYAYLQ